MISSDCKIHGLVMGLLCFWGISLCLHSAPTIPPGFASERVVEGINAATALVVAPDGRVFYAEQTGAIHVVKNGTRLPEPALDLNERLDTWWERGLIGLTLHPDFPSSPYLYTVYVAKAPYSHHVVSRWTVVGDQLDPASEWVLWEGEDQSQLGGNVPAGHQGGPICFGEDGCLYFGIGEQTAGKPSQSLESFLGKILRIRPDGTLPKDNPFYDEAQGKYRAIYAIGIRNPFGLVAEPGTGRLLETDVGASAFEEINAIVAGGNYGWPEAEGFSDDARFLNPLHAYPPAIGRSICGGMIYPPEGAFPEEWHGRFFFVDWANHWIKAIDLEDPRELISFADGLEAPVGIVPAPDGSLYVLNRNTRWRDGNKFEDNVGSLIRIRYVGEQGASEREVPRYPETLAETGVFEDVSALQPAAGFHRLAFNIPRWRPGVRAQRWIQLPPGAVVALEAETYWTLPEDAVVVEHFDTVSGWRHETHVYESKGDGSYRAVAYRWLGPSETVRVAHGEIVPLPGSEGWQWYSPGPMDGFRPELAVAGYDLPLNQRQLDSEAQLEEWRQRGWLTQLVPPGPKLVAWEDNEAALEDRARSYLDANCASCHRPGGPSRGFFDARLSTPLRDQGLVQGDLMAGDLGIEGAAVVVPGSPERSILWQRMRRHDAFRMPPVAVNAVTSPAVEVIGTWIASMPARSENRVRLTREATDPSADNLPAYKIETAAATYFLEKTGAGLSSLVDSDGNDWLGFHPRKGSGAGGEYRGFPNAVHQQAGNYFHARNAATDPATTLVMVESPHHVAIAAEGENGLWACRYDFYPSHCTFTMTKMPADKRYWALYEGTPGGDYDDEDWWMTSGHPEKRSLTERHEGDLPAPEWIAFGDPGLERALFLFHHEDDAHPDDFYQMQKQMTVFGFGRRGIGKYLDAVPQSISIGLVESSDHRAVSKTVSELAAEAP